jgi:molecular chaperone GrpE (heat shock protein)
MSDCDQSCDGCPNKAEHHLCDACCHDEVDAIQRENRELQEQLEAAQAEIARLKKAMEDRWYDCHDGSEQACCKSHE